MIIFTTVFWISAQKLFETAEKNAIYDVKLMSVVIQKLYKREFEPYPIKKLSSRVWFFLRCQIDNVINANIIKFGKPNKVVYRDLTCTFFVSAIHFSLTTEIFCNLLLGIIVVDS